MNGTSEWNQVDEARQMMEVMATRKEINILPEIQNVEFHIDNNLTVAIVDSTQGRSVGWAKFNPKDVKRLTLVNKKGRTFTKTISMYNERIGQCKALSRALQRLLQSQEAPF